MNAKPAAIEESMSNDERERAPDVLALMTEIRARVDKELEGRDSRPRFVPTAADDSARSARKAGELLYSEELRYLNTHYAYGSSPPTESIVSHRSGILGKIIVRTKRKIASFIWNLFREYFVSEREFQANVVRFLNDASKYVDSRDASNFWELIRKVDVDVAKALERIERLHDEYAATAHNLERRVSSGVGRDIGELKAGQAAHEQQLRTLDSVARGLEGIVSLSGKAGQPVAPSGSEGEASSAPDFSYVLLENRFRGSEAEIAERVVIYPPYFKSADKPVLEIGAGRGELQRLFREEGVRSYGVDLDQGMVAVARERGEAVEFGDALAHLRNLEDGSLGGVIAVQVVEHLTREQLHTLFQLCRSKVAAGGKIIFETINPRSLLALSSNYFRDPTHVWPLHPDTLSYMMELDGLRVEEVRMLSKVPDEALLRRIPKEPFMSPKWEATVDSLNDTLDRLNELLYGHQDYCVVAVV